MSVACEIENSEKGRWRKKKSRPPDDFPQLGVERKKERDWVEGPHEKQILLHFYCAFLQWKKVAKRGQAFFFSFTKNWQKKRETIRMFSFVGKQVERHCTAFPLVAKSDCIVTLRLPFSCSRSGDTPITKSSEFSQKNGREKKQKNKSCLFIVIALWKVGKRGCSQAL